MLKKEAIVLHKNLFILKGLSGAKFAYAIARNTDKLQSEMKALDTAKEQSEAFKTYNTERENLAKKHAVKDDKGQPVVKDNQYVIEDNDAFNKEIKTLQKQHATAIEAYEKQLEDYNKLLETESEVELYKIPLSDIPENISVEQMSALYPLIQE